MLLHVPLSVGEVLDKVTILEIKSERIDDAAKLKNINNELAQLRALLTDAVFDEASIKSLVDELKQINEALWDIEDNIRDQEMAGTFGDRFIELARAVYVTNDKRAMIKKKLNEETGSTLVEEKSYKDYSGA
jgi:predicted  nucleic acid-binding Zn-ribbon protein